MITIELSDILCAHVSLLFSFSQTIKKKEIDETRRITTSNHGQ